MAKPKCTPELIEAASELKRGGMNNKDTARCLGISEATLYRWLSSPTCEEHREFCESLKRAEVEYKSTLRERIIKAAERDWKAAAWLLERRYPDEYGRRERREVISERERAPRIVDAAASPEAVEKAEELLEMLYGTG